MKLKLLFFGFIFLNFNFLFAQDFVLPPKINFDQNSGIVGFSYDVRIWGWSRNGKVAYSTEYEWSEIFQNINFFILDLISDKILFQFHLGYKDEDYGQVRDEALYDANRTLILNALRTHNIIRHDLIERQTEFLQFPFRRNNVLYDCRLINIVYVETEYGQNNLSRYAVSVIANEKRKIIGNFTTQPLVDEVYVKGYFLSPFENRIMVAAAEMSGYQYGPRGYRFMGCHLEVGFK